MMLHYAPAEMATPPEVLAALLRPTHTIPWVVPETEYQTYRLKLPPPYTPEPSGPFDLTSEDQRLLMTALCNSGELLYEF